MPCTQLRCYKPNSEDLKAYQCTKICSIWCYYIWDKCLAKIIILKESYAIFVFALLHLDIIYYIRYGVYCHNY